MWDLKVCYIIVRRRGKQLLLKGCFLRSIERSMSSCLALLRCKAVVFRIRDLTICNIKSLLYLRAWYLKKEGCLDLKTLITYIVYVRGIIFV